MMASFLFLSLALLLGLGVAGVFIWYLMRPNPEGTSHTQSLANAALYRSQIFDLDRERENGHISEQEWQQARDELSVRMLQDTAAQEGTPTRSSKPAWWSAAFLVIALPLSSVSAYLWLGEPAAFNPAAAVAAAADTPAQQELVAMADALATKLEADPNNPQGWVMLGRTYRTLGDYTASLQAYDRAMQFDRGEDLLLERAEVVATSQGGSFEGEPWRVIRKLLQEQPNHLGALLLAGSASYADGQPQNALTYWQQARGQVGADHPDVPNLEAAIAEVQKQLGQAVNINTDGPSISGRVTVSEALKNQTNPTDTVFIYAVATEGPRMPVAIIKTTVAGLTASFRLDDSTAMSPQFKLSSLSEVMLTARVSKSGNAIPQPGDLIATMGPVKVGARDLALTISEVLP